MRADENGQRSILHQKIQTLKNELLSLTEKLEQLKIELITIKQEYDVKIGKLYLNIDELDLEILKFEKIEKLLRKRFSFEKAEKIVRDELKVRQEKINEEHKKINEESEIIEKRKNTSENEKKELKTLWRKLAHKYHPDLARNENDRKKYEEIMKKINRAYSEGDMEALMTIQQEYVENSEVISVEILETKLVNIEIAISCLESEYLMLKKSEWQIWKNNIEDAKEHGRDLLFELEQRLLRDISAKTKILQEYQKKYDSK
ncbi:MAG: DnaJ domain-containing protein [Candidatus Moraniibacteriota bacterium]